MKTRKAQKNKVKNILDAFSVNCDNGQQARYYDKFRVWALLPTPKKTTRELLLSLRPEKKISQ